MGYTNTRWADDNGTAGRGAKKNENKKRRKPRENTYKCMNKQWEEDFILCFFHSGIATILKKKKEKKHSVVIVLMLKCEPLTLYCENNHLKSQFSYYNVILSPVFYYYYFHFICLIEWQQWASVVNMPDCRALLCLCTDYRAVFLEPQRSFEWVPYASTRGDTSSMKWLQNKVTVLPFYVIIV